jgi:hypothetical protein
MWHHTHRNARTDLDYFDARRPEIDAVLARMVISLHDFVQGQ